MISKERVKRAIHFQGPNHIPHYLPDGEENDILWLWSDWRKEENPWKESENGIWERRDIWGTLWRRFGPQGIGEAADLPLSDWDRFDSYIFPEINRANVEQSTVKQMYDNPDKYFLGVMPYSSLFEGAHNIRGLENLLVDFYEESEKVNRLLAQLMEGQIRSIDILNDLGVDGVMGYDDWGIQDRPLISMALWDQYFRPRYQKIWDYAHSKGLDIWLHSCGYILPFLKEMVKIGLNVIQMDQQENIGLEILDREVGGKVAFWCPVDIQQTMIQGSLEDIRQYVKKMIYHLGRFNGGLISMYYTSPNVINHTEEKLLMMSQAFREYGVYPVSDSLL